MKVIDMRAGGVGVPQMFKIEPADHEVLDELARIYVWSIYNSNVYEWAGRDWMMQQIEEAVERGGEPELEEIVDQFAADMGLERA